MIDYVYERREIVLPISKKTVVLQEGSGYSERVLLRRGKMLFEAFIDALVPNVVSIGSTTTITAAHILDLFVQDIEALQIEDYKLKHGNEFEFSDVCLNCGETGEHLFDLNDLAFLKLSPDIDSEDPVVTVTLPKTKVSVTLGLLKGSQQLVLLNQASSSGVDPNQSMFQSIRLLDGSADFSYEDIIALPAKDHKALREARAKLACGYDLNVRVLCPSCGFRYTVNVVSHRDFLLPGGWPE